MKSIIIGTIALLGSAAYSMAADAPNMLGTWHVVQHAVAEAHGDSSFPPRLMHDSGDHGWTHQIDQQDGPSFSGIAIAPDGHKDRVVGTFRTDGRRFVLSTDYGVAEGEVNGDTAELCWTDTVPMVLRAACETLQHQK